MAHLSTETLAELLDGGPAPGSEAHLAACTECQAELEMLRRLRTELRELPALEPPPEVWSRIEERLPVVRARRRWMKPGLAALQVAAMAAVFVIGLGLGKLFQSETPATQVAEGSIVPVEQPAATTSLPEAMAEVRRLASEYDAALLNLQRLADRQGASVPSTLAQQRLASLEALVDASRAALAADPADPMLNSYLFAAIEERDAMVRQLSDARGSGSGVTWR